MTMAQMAEEMEVLEEQICPVCSQKGLTLMDYQKDIPYFGKTYFFSMDCNKCGYHKADIENDEDKEPCKYTLEITSEADMKIRVAKSSNATIKIPFVGDIESGPSSNGYVTNVEGILNRMQKQVENIRDNSDDEEERKKAKNLAKKITKILWGQEKAKLILEDPTGNSAIISDKAKKEKLKK
ncbi:ZPR1 zinc finger domain-containing protein [Candidatus Woesearchaeota archaeon]|nr:MAG: ZPR1 zinc finger domain-containing protein [Candidatus Woesearchaeota archaeon]